jgi:hypothetical protein
VWLASSLTCAVLCGAVLCCALLRCAMQVSNSPIPEPGLLVALMTGECSVGGGGYHFVNNRRKGLGSHHLAFGRVCLGPFRRWASNALHVSHRRCGRTQLTWWVRWEWMCQVLARRQHFSAVLKAAGCGYTGAQLQQQQQQQQHFLLV